MKNRLKKKFSKCFFILFSITLATLSANDAKSNTKPEQTLSFTSPQTAVLDPVSWDKSFPSERYFDAVRAMLVRFPDMAEAVYAKLQKGYAIEKVELILDWERQEGSRPERGRSGWGADGQYEKNPGRWHVQAQRLCRPWSIENPALAPTFNAYINGLGFWESGGARSNSTDRVGEVFGPMPLHEETPQARLDVTAVLCDDAYGDTVGERLRALENYGFQVHKHEIRDMSYRHFYAYDWAVSIAYMRIWVAQPMLTVTFRKTSVVDRSPLPKPIDIPSLAKKLQTEGKRGSPSVTYPDKLAKRAAEYWRQPPDMPDWQKERIEDLRKLQRNPDDVVLALGRGFNWGTLFAGDRDVYMAAMREILRMPPRTWQGHLSSDFALLPSAYGDLLPEGVMDHLKLYWTAWLHPETERRGDIGGGTHRGGPSYFRGYTGSMGTMNFTFNANMGSLLGAQLIESPFVLNDARWGIERLVAGSHLFNTGAHQEIGDTYYHALTIGAAGAMARFSSDPYDRLMGKIIQDRMLECLVSMYHPGLRRMTHPMGRGHYAYHLLLQEGSQHVMHTLSRKGALIHLDDVSEDRKGPPKNWGKVHGLDILGDEGPPMRMAVLSPWVDSYLAEPIADIVDAKPYPWSVHARDFSPGCRNGGWHVNFLSEHYSIASRDNANYNYGVTSVIAQWRRQTEQVESLEDTGTLILDFSNDDSFTRSNLSMAEFGIAQHNNKLLAMKRLPEANQIQRNAKNPDAIHSLHVSALVLSFGNTAEREVWINNRRADAVSGAREAPDDNWQKRVESRGERIKASDGDVITINDGVTFIGLIPITANAMNRIRQVEIAFEQPVMLIHSYIYDDPDNPVDLDKMHELKQVPTAGFVIEMGDISQYESFEAFRRHMLSVKLESSWNADARNLDLRYHSGNDLLEMTYDPLTYPAVARAINGKWPYLPEGTMRESEWAVQGRQAVLTKNGASLTTAEGSHAYLLASPSADFFIGYNPFPKRQPWRMTLPNNTILETDGEVGLLRTVVRPEENRIWIEHQEKPGELEVNDDNNPKAKGMRIFGFKKIPKIILNGQPVNKPEKLNVQGQDAYWIPFDN